MSESCDIAVVGGGAAGLMAAIWAGRTRPGSRIVVLDGAKRLGAKILVAGGGRCNVTHFEVSERDYAGSTGPAIRKVLARFDVARTVEFFRGLGVELKREETGKLFPVTDDARTVLDALLGAARRAGVEIRNPWRVNGIERARDAFLVVRALDEEGPAGEGGEPLSARRVILATGGKSLPKTGSDGGGYGIARSLGHSITEHVFPALVPLTLPKGFFLCGLSGIAVPATIELRSGAGKRLRSFTDSTLFTHFGLSGPSVLNISRSYTAAKTEAGDGPEPYLSLNVLPGETIESVDEALRSPGRAAALRRLSGRVPERLARTLCEFAGVDVSAAGDALTREARRRLAAACTELRLPVTGDRGWLFAEATAGGVPLRELRLETMESRVCPGLHICGEVCDVDGRLGGFNFQWAWASGYVAGCGAAVEAAYIRP